MNYFEYRPFIQTEFRNQPKGYYLQNTNHVLNGMFMGETKAAARKALHGLNERRKGLGLSTFE